MNTCKEDIVHRYREGLISQKQLRSIKNAQMGRDKYWNVSLEDSPYDILYDVWMVSKLIFEEVQDPRSVTFFQMPASNA
ncbi:MAG: hypothetical protein LBI53_08395 [Candidatus Peribacteria bacterium]|nr:hypothetical protein [Candidatus Peribacteria bacterium]